MKDTILNGSFDIKFTGFSKYGFYVALLAALLMSAFPSTSQAETKNIWISEDEIKSLPTSGTAWNNLVSGADHSVSNPDFRDQDDKTDVYIMAKALVYAKTKNSTTRSEVVDGLKRLVELHPISESLRWDALGTVRALGSYAIAADLIDLKAADSTFDTKFRNWLSAARFADTEGGRGSVVEIQEARPNNWGAHAVGSRVAADLYLGDTADLEKAIKVLKGYLGDRSSYTGFRYAAEGDLSWQSDQSKPVGINPKGSTISGRDVDGIIPDDQRRCGSFVWAPCKTNYAWEGLQGIVAAAEMLDRAGYDAYNWQDQAILRAIDWLHRTTFSDGTKYPAEGDDEWQVWLINGVYGTNYPTDTGVSPGKMVGWTDWSHSGPRNTTTPPNPSPNDTTSPSVPGNLTGVAISTTEVKLDWSASTDNVGVDRYKIYRDGRSIDSGSANSYSDKGLVENTNYKYEVSAVDATGNESAKSSIVNVTTKTGTQTPSTPPLSENSKSLANSATLMADSKNFALDRGPDKLWDDCYSDRQRCMAGNSGITSYWLDFDFGSLHALSKARLFGDAEGTWLSTSWTLQYKKNLSDSWTTVFSKSNAFGSEWFEKNLSSIQARYVRVTVYGNQDRSRTQARELEIFGTPVSGSVPPPDTTSPIGVVGVSGSVTLLANATDNVGVTGVQFVIDGANFGNEDTSSPYSLSWDTTKVSDGVHAISAIARDAAGNKTVLNTSSVNILNNSSTLSSVSSSNNLTLQQVNSSNKFQTAMKVVTQTSLNVRSIASLVNSSILQVKQAGSVGTIISGPKLSDGHVWWYVDYETGIDGWSAENWLKEI